MQDRDILEYFPAILRQPGQVISPDFAPSLFEARIEFVFTCISGQDEQARPPELIGDLFVRSGGHRAEQRVDPVGRDVGGSQGLERKAAIGRGQRFPARLIGLSLGQQGGRNRSIVRPARASASGCQPSLSRSARAAPPSSTASIVVSRPVAALLCCVW